MTKERNFHIIQNKQKIECKLTHYAVSESETMFELLKLQVTWNREANDKKIKGTTKNNNKILQKEKQQ